MTSRRLSVLICCYGDFPQYSLRAVRSVVESALPGERKFDLLVGANQCCAETALELRRLADQGQIDTLIETSRNLNKDPITRYLLECTQTEYLLWMDDDSYVEAGWDRELYQLIEREHPFDAAGCLQVMRRDDEYRAFLRKRPWFVSEEKFVTHPSVWAQSQDIARNLAIFPPGALYLARAEFLRKHHYPDKAMVKIGGDRLLGDLIVQQEGKLLLFEKRLNSIFHHNAGDRRGEGEDSRDYRGVNPITGDPENARIVGAAASLQKSNLAEDHRLRDQPRELEEKDLPVWAKSSSSQQAKKREHEDFIALNDKGNKLTTAGKHQEAVAAYREALRLASERPELHYNLGNALRNCAREEEAIASFERAIELKSDYAEAWNNLGIALCNVGRKSEAVAAYKSSIRYNPQNHGAYHNLGSVLEQRGELLEASDAYRQSLALHWNSVQTHCFLARLLARTGTLSEALVHYGITLLLNPNYLEARRERAELLLAQGIYDPGLDELDRCGASVISNSRKFRQPLWDGSPSAGKVLLVYQDGSPAEVLQNMRYLPALADSGADIIVECQEDLCGLVGKGSSFDVFATGKPLPGFEVRTPFSSLPRIMQTTLETVPWPGPYLKAAKHSSINLPQICSGALRVGVVWRDEWKASAQPAGDIPLEGLRPLYDIPGVVCVTLQSNLTETEQALLQSLPTAGQQLLRTNGITELAAVISQLDLLICADGVVAQLAGALGKRVWVLASSRSKWCWVHGQRQTPWYPTAEVFWASKPNVWDIPVGEVVEKLKTEIEDRFRDVGIQAQADLKDKQ